MSSSNASVYRPGVTVTPLAGGLFKVVCLYCTHEWRERGDERPRPECACNGGKVVQ